MDTEMGARPKWVPNRCPIEGCRAAITDWFEDRHVKTVRCQQAHWSAVKPIDPRPEWAPDVCPGCEAPTVYWWGNLYGNHFCCKNGHEYVATSGAKPAGDPESEPKGPVRLQISDVDPSQEWARVRPIVDIMIGERAYLEIMAVLGEQMARTHREALAS